jgi:hypothetical protein
VVRRYFLVLKEVCTLCFWGFKLDVLWDVTSDSLHSCSSRESCSTNGLPIEHALNLHSKISSYIGCSARVTRNGMYSWAEFLRASECRIHYYISFFLRIVKCGVTQFIFVPMVQWWFKGFLWGLGVKNGERLLLHHIRTWNCHHRVVEIINESTPLLYSSIGGRVLPLKEGKKGKKKYVLCCGS